jgi:hypothetical protein
MSALGLENVQILHHCDYDTTILQENDWDEKEVPDQMQTFTLSSDASAEAILDR